MLLAAKENCFLSYCLLCEGQELTDSGSNSSEAAGQWSVHVIIWQPANGQMYAGKSQKPKGGLYPFAPGIYSEAHR